MRKINAVLSLLSTFLLMDHAIFQAVRMLSGGSVAENAGFISWILVGLMLTHAFVSIELAVSAHADIEKRKCKNYPKLNVATNIQRASGMLMIVFAALHVAGTMGYLQPPPAVHAILPPVFFAVSLIHAAVSVSKAFITLGIGNAKTVKVIDIAVKALCCGIWIADVIGFYLHAV